MREYFLATALMFGGVFILALGFCFFIKAFVKDEGFTIKTFNVVQSTNQRGEDELE